MHGHGSPLREEHLKLLEELTAGTPHQGGTLYDHLVGTGRILEAWGRPPDVCVAGLFHSVYGTQSYQLQVVGPTDRARVRACIGERAERLVHLFSVVDRRAFFLKLADPAPRIHDRVGDREVSVSHQDLVALVEIELANRLELVPRVRLGPQELAELRVHADTARDDISLETFESIVSAIRTASLVCSDAV